MLSCVRLPSNDESSQPGKRIFTVMNLQFESMSVDHGIPLSGIENVDARLGKKMQNYPEGSSLQDIRRTCAQQTRPMPLPCRLDRSVTRDARAPPRRPRRWRAQSRSRAVSPRWRVHRSSPARCRKVPARQPGDRRVRFGIAR